MTTEQKKKKQISVEEKKVCGHSNVTFIMFYMVLYLYPIWKGQQIIENIFVQKLCTLRFLTSANKAEAMYERSPVNVKKGPFLPLRAAFHTFPLFYLGLYFLFNNKLLLLKNVITHGIGIHDTLRYCL